MFYSVFLNCSVFVPHGTFDILIIMAGCMVRDVKTQDAVKLPVMYRTAPNYKELFQQVSKSAKAE